MVAVAAPPRPSVAFERDLPYRQQITARADRVRWIVVPPRRYLMIEGTEAPAEPGFREAIGALYPVAYTLHFALKRRGVEAPVGALEGLYWIGEVGPTSAARFTTRPDQRGGWSWRLMLPIPDGATAVECAAAIDDVRGKKNPPRLDQLRCQAWDEGPVAQIMHVGPYDAEAPTIARLHAAVAEAGLRLHGCHHEIYISEPNRTAPKRLKTLLRQPVVVP